VGDPKSSPGDGASTVAIDVGGTEIKGAIRDSTGSLVALRRWPTSREAGPTAVVDLVLSALDQLLRDAPATQAVGLVVPGTVDEANGVAVYSENIEWRDVPFRRLARDASALPVGFGHDVRAGGLAERTLGASRGSDDVLFMPIGTGISGAMIVEGRSIDNMLGGEIGHLDVGSGLACVCGLTGCLETVATGPSIARSYFEVSGTQVSGAKPVVELMQAGDPQAKAVWQGAVDSIAAALASYISLLAPELVVIGGGLSGAGDLLLDPLRIALRSRLVWQREPRLVIAELGDLAGNVGAHLLAQRAMELTGNGGTAS
jgi:glucokinase